MTNAIRAAVGALILILVGCNPAEDNSFANPNWAESVNRSATLPLTVGPILTVGLADGMTVPSPDDPRIAWLTEQTGATFEFLSIPSSPGDIEFGEMIREGALPDIIAEARVDLREPTMHRLFVDFLQFPELLPRFTDVLARHEILGQSIRSRLTADGKLLSLGTFDVDALPFYGVLAYREDLFAEHDLQARTWDELTDAMTTLKEIYPDSYPFGGRFATVLRLMPSWFGSGYDPQHVVYYDVDADEWRFGPFEDEFLDFVSFLAESYQGGLVDPNMIAGSDDQEVRSFVNDVVFVAPYRGATGPLFPFPAEDYGELTESGEWDGSGRWISSLPLPPAPSGDRRYITSERFDPLRPGWLVYTQGQSVGESIAVMDFLYSQEASAVLALGPPGADWAFADDGIELSTAARAAYDEGGLPGLRRHLGFEEDIPLSGLAFDAHGLLGYPASPSFTYYRATDLASNEPGGEVMVDPGVRIPLDDEEFSSRRIDAVVTLQSHVESQVANFVIGRRPLSEWGDFLDRAREMGAQRLVDLYNEEAVVPEATELAPLLD